jgi:S-adenosylmethionine:tRNA ribosyltransferase-isomerase
LDFALPSQLEAGEPAEARGIDRDQVRLLVTRGEGEAEHAIFRALPEFLDPGDLVLINTSATIPAALSGRREDGRALEVHLSTRLPAGMWSAELRLMGEGGSQPFFAGRSGEVIELAGGGQLKLYAPYREGRRGQPTDRVRLWVCGLALPVP